MSSGFMAAPSSPAAAIAADGVIQAGCSAIAFSSSLRAGVGAVCGGDPRTAGREAAAKAFEGIEDAPHHLMLLFVEMTKATRTDSLAIINHGLSMLVAVICIIEFVAVRGFTNSTCTMGDPSGSADRFGISS